MKEIHHSILQHKFGQASQISSHCNLLSLVIKRHSQCKDVVCLYLSFTIPDCQHLSTLWGTRPRVTAAKKKQYFPHPPHTINTCCLLGRPAETSVIAAVDTHTLITTVSSDLHRVKLAMPPQHMNSD